MAAKKKTTPAIAKTSKKNREDSVYWVLSARTKLLFWEPLQLYSTKAAADLAHSLLEKQAPYSFNSYKVSRVDLVG